MSAVTDEVTEVFTAPVNEKPDIPSLKKDGKDGREFRIQNKYVFLTYSNVHIPKEWFKFEFIKKRVKWDVEQCEIAHENGSSKFGGYKHTHVYLVAKTKFDNRDARILDLSSTKDIDILRYVDEDGTEKIANGHPNIRIPANKKHRDNILRYLGKEDPENAHLLIAEQTPVERLWNAKNLTEAVKNVSRLSDVIPAMAAYRLKPKDQREVGTFIFPWQEQFHDWIVNTRASCREIIWLYCNTGNSGKTRMATIMLEKYPEDFRVMTNLGQVGDALNVLAGFVNEGWNGKYLWLDLPRSYDGRDVIYPVLEQVKNAVFTATKYMGGSYAMQYVPHVIVTANFLPKVHAMSLDRWSICEMSGERPNFWLRKMDLNEVITKCDKIEKEKRVAALMRKAEAEYEEKMAYANFYASKGISMDRFGKPVFPQSCVPIDYGSSSSALPTSSAPPAEWGFRTDFSKQE